MENNWKEYIKYGSNLRWKNGQASEDRDLKVVEDYDPNSSVIKCVRQCEYRTYLAIKKKDELTLSEKSFLKELEKYVCLDDFYTTDMVCIREVSVSDTGAYQWKDKYILKSGSVIELETDDGRTLRYVVYPYGSDYYHIYAGEEGYCTHVYHIDEFAEMIFKRRWKVKAAHEPEEK